MEFEKIQKRMVCKDKEIDLMLDFMNTNNPSKRKKIFLKFKKEKAKKSKKVQIKWKDIELGNK